MSRQNLAFWWFKLYSFSDEQCVTDRLFISADLYFWPVISKDLSSTVFRVGEKAMSYKTQNQTKEIKEAAHIFLTFSLRSDSFVQTIL